MWWLQAIFVLFCFLLFICEIRNYSWVVNWNNEKLGQMLGLLIIIYEIGFIELWKMLEVTTEKVSNAWKKCTVLFSQEVACK